MKPEELHATLTEAYNAGNLDGMLALYDPEAVFVIKPGRVTQGREELRAALARLVELRGRMTISPQSFVRSGNVVLVLGRFALSGQRRDGSPLELGGRFADVLRQQPDGRWLLAVDDGFAGE